VPQSAFSYYYGYTSQGLKVSETLVYGEEALGFRLHGECKCRDGTTSEGLFDWPSTAPPPHGSFGFTDQS